VACDSARRKLAAGRPAQALAVLPDATADEDAVRVGTLRAALLLALGRVDAARDQGLDRSRDAAVAALEAIIHVARNEQDEALAAADEAVATDAGSAAAYLALSYARQARGEPEQALEAARDATRVAEENPFAWARRGELELSLAQTAQGRASVEHALALAPALPRAQALLGFAHLLEGRTRDALARFDVVIAADPDEPLAHFGRGLARIRSQEFAEGRRDVEIAVARPRPTRSCAATSPPVRRETARPRGRGVRSRSPARSRVADAVVLRRFPPPARQRTVGALADGRARSNLNDRRVVIGRRCGSTPTGRRAVRASAPRRRRSDSRNRCAPTPSRRSQTIRSARRDTAGSPYAYAALPRSRCARVSELLQTQLASRRPPAGSAAILAPTCRWVDAPRALAPEEAAELFERGPSQLAATALAARRRPGRQSCRGPFVGARPGVARALRLPPRRPRAGREIDLSGTRVGLQFAATPATMLLAEVGTSDRRGGDVVEQLLAGRGCEVPLRLDHRVRTRPPRACRCDTRPGSSANSSCPPRAGTRRSAQHRPAAGDICFPFRARDF